MDKVLTRKLFKDTYLKSLGKNISNFNKGGLASLKISYFRIGGSSITGDPYVSKEDYTKDTLDLNRDTDTWEVVRYEYDFAIPNFYLNNNIYGTPDFLCYTPEMMISFLSNRRIKELAAHQHPGKLGSNTSKYIVYNSNNNFNLEPRQKYTGYEKIENSDIFKHEVFSEFSKLKKKWGGIDRQDYYEFMKNTI